MISKKRIFGWIACLLLVTWLAFDDRLTIHNTWFCARCLQQVREVKESTFGITYSSKKTYRMEGELLGTWSEDSDSGLYSEITGHPCVHDFILRSFARCKHGGVGCGGGFESDFMIRSLLLDGVFHAYLRVPDKTLARESLARIDEFLPIHKPDGRYNNYDFLLIIDLDTEALPNEPVSICFRGLPLVNSREEWRQLLERSQASTEAFALLQDRGLLIKRIKARDIFR